MDAGPERISDPAELAQVRRQALKVHIPAVVSALLGTAVAVCVG